MDFACFFQRVMLQLSWTVRLSACWCQHKSWAQDPLSTSWWSRGGTHSAASGPDRQSPGIWIRLRCSRIQAGWKWIHTHLAPLGKKGTRFDQVKWKVRLFTYISAFYKRKLHNRRRCYGYLSLAHQPAREEKRREEKRSEEKRREEKRREEKRREEKRREEKRREERRGVCWMH